MIDSQELRDRTLEAAAARIQELTRCRWDDAMDAAVEVVGLVESMTPVRPADACNSAGRHSHLSGCGDGRAGVVLR